MQLPFWDLCAKHRVSAGSDYVKCRTKMVTAISVKKFKTAGCDLLLVDPNMAVVPTCRKRSEREPDKRGSDGESIKSAINCTGITQVSCHYDLWKCSESTCHVDLGFLQVRMRGCGRIA
jgi:hypothetical protein